MLPTIVQGLLPLITLPIFTRVLTRADYGLWGIATAFGALVSGAAGLGLQAGFDRNYFAEADSDSRARLLYSVVIFAALVQCITLVIALVLSPRFAARLMETRENAPLLVLAFTTSAVGVLKAFYMSTLRNEGRARDYVIFSIDELALGALLSLGLVLGLDFGVTGLLLGSLLAALTVFVALVVSFARRTTFGVDRGKLIGVLRIGLPLAPRALIGAVGSQLDRLILGATTSLSAVGVYVVGQRIAQLVFAFMTALQNVYQPIVYRMLFANAAPTAVGRFLLPFAYASAAVAFVAVLFAREIVWLFTPPQFRDAGIILAILGVHYGLMFFGKQPQLIFAKRTGLVSYISVATIVLNATGLYVGITQGGAQGAAWGAMAAGVVSGLGGLAVAHHFTPINYPLRATVLVFASLPAALLITLELSRIDPGLPVTLAIKTAALAIFGIFGWRAGLLSAVWTARTEVSDAA